MDEPTLDCSYCSEPGHVERQLQALDDNADWRTIYTVVLCRKCWEGVALASTARLQPHERLVLMPL